jgi:hypothetical protein
LDELSAKVAFIEARLTLLERQFSRLISASPYQGQKPTEPIVLSCSQPGLMISRMYPEEKDGTGRVYCWVGNEGPVQFVLPIRPFHPLTCTLHIQPHPNVDLSALAILVNDEEQLPRITHPNKHITDVSFAVPTSGASCLSVILLGVTSIRPSDFGENTDNRLLAARFFGATVTFD